jgi:hypothetical protein
MAMVVMARSWTERKSRMLPSARASSAAASPAATALIARTAVAGHGAAGDAKLGERGDQLGWKLLALPVLSDDGQDPGVAESPDAIADRPLLAGEELVEEEEIRIPTVRFARRSESEPG